jgi:mercuric ion binding protein
MNFTKSLLSLLITLLLISCKETASKPLSNSKESTAEEKVTVVTKPETASFKIEGMTCAMGCAKTIETKLSNMNGVQKATIDFDKKQATVNFDGAVLNSEKISKAIESTGDGETYKASEIKTKG